MKITRRQLRRIIKEAIESSQEFIIMKRTRAYDNPTPRNAYRGPATERVGIEPGKVYTSYEEAEADAALLARENPVGFEVVELIDYKTGTEY